MRCILLLVILAGPHLSMAQDDYPYPSLSPKGTITQAVGNTEISVVYERPSVRGRKIYGGLVPWNKVWRTGAGHCTTVSFDRPVIVGGQPIDSGTYSLFTIPDLDKWVVIFNADTTLYGSGKYNPIKDVARFSVQPTKTGRFYEALTIDIDLVPNNAEMYVSWANTQIGFPIQTTTDAEIDRFIETELISGKSKVSDSYAGAASYLYFQRTDYQLALTLSRKALALDPNNTWTYNTEIAIYKELKLYDKALLALEELLERVKKRPYEKEAYREEDIKQIKERYTQIEKQMQ